MKTKAGVGREKKVKMWGLECAMDYKIKDRQRAKFYINRKYALEKAKENGTKVVPVVISFIKFKPNSRREEIRKEIPWLNLLCFIIGMTGVLIVTKNPWALFWAWVAALHFTYITYEENN